MKECKRSVCFSLQATNNQVKRTIAKKMSIVFKDQSNMMQHRILGYVHNRQEDVFQKDIEELLKIRRSTATGVLNTLEKRELIHREPVSYDARLKKLVVTVKGIEFEKKAIECLKEIENEVRFDLSEEELDTFFRVLDKIKNNVEDDY
ncbi:MAG: MarR family transcriptional regulator [Pisciglobus halotolerans]|nr:MarR family transcriptional regulator [Pisciglobus halotolerans]